MTSKNNSTLIVSSALALTCAAAAGYFFSSGTNDQGSHKQAHGTSTNGKPPRPPAPRRSLTRRKDSTIEICLSDIQSLRNALAGGCNSVELCVDRTNGGVTPSIGLIEQAVTVIGGRDVALHVLIRPRAGGFHYTDDEFDIIQRDILAARMAGADGIVFGALDAQGKIDVARMKLIRELSKGMILTFHRAFDVCAEDPSAALETIINLGCDRLLTSGSPHSRAVQNLDSLKALQQAARGRIEIVAAAGVAEDNAAQLVHATGITALHAGSSVCTVTSEQRPVAEPGTPARPSTASFAAASAGSPGLGDSFIAVERHPNSSSTGGRAGAGTTSPPAQQLEELRSWQCVDEERVCRLVAAVKTAVAQRLTSKGTESPVPDADYVRL